MKKLIKLTLIAIFLGIHPMSCINRDPDMCGDTSRWAKVVEIQSLYTSIVQSSEMWDTRYLEDTSAYYLSEEIGFTIAINQTIKIAENSPKFNFGNIAWACSPVTPAVNNPIKSVAIIYKGESQSLNDSIFLNSGDIISDYFRYVNLDDWEPSSSHLYDITFENPTSSDRLLIKLVEPNKEKMELPFTAVVTLTDNKTFEFNNLRFKLLPSK